MYLAHAGGRYIAQAQVQGEIRADLDVILNEQLRTLQPHIGRLLIGRAPVFDIAQQEIREPRTGVLGAIVGGISPGEAESARVNIPPRRGVTVAHEHLSPEMQDVLAMDQGHHVRRVIETLEINRIGTRGELYTALTANVYNRENVRLRVLQTQGRRGIKPEGLRNEPVALLGITHAERIDQCRADFRGNCYLRVVTVDVAGIAVQRAGCAVDILSGVVFLADREGNAVFVREIIVDAPKIPEIRVRSGRHKVEVVGQSSRGTRIRQWVVGQNLRRHRVDPAAGDGVAGERGANPTGCRLRIVDCDRGSGAQQG